MIPSNVSAAFIGARPLSRIYRGAALLWDWSPEKLFAGGKSGIWADGFNPGAGRMFQDAAGITPAVNPGHPVGRLKRAAGTADAMQATALSRPTLARHPKGGRRSMYTQNVAAWSGESVDAVMLASSQADPLGKAASLRLDLSSEQSRRFHAVTGIAPGNYVYSVWLRADVPTVVGLRAVALGQLVDGGATGAHWGENPKITVGTEWKRFSCRIAASSAVSLVSASGGIENRAGFG